MDPPDKAGLAQLVAEAAQEGTTTRSSEQLKREVFAMGATLSGAAGQDSTSFQMRGLAETLPQYARRCSPTSCATPPSRRPRST